MIAALLPTLGDWLALGAWVALAGGMLWMGWRRADVAGHGGRYEWRCPRRGCGYWVADSDPVRVAGMGSAHQGWCSD